MVELNKERYKEFISSLEEVSINTLFARAVIEGQVNGTVYVDELISPKTFYISHPYGMSLLFGKSNNKEFNKSFKDYALNTFKVRNAFEWLQVFPSTWERTINKLFQGHIIESSCNKPGENSNLIEINTRVNFKFKLVKCIQGKMNLPKDLKLVRTDLEAFQKMKGSVVPKLFWKTAEDFLSNGIGFSSFIDSELACTAYSAFIFEGKLEIGIETVKAFRGRGLAFHTCSKLIDYCITKGLEPVWACRLDNTESYKLAKKLGFEPSIEIPYYRLAI